MRLIQAILAVVITVVLSAGLASAGLPGVALEGAKSPEGPFKDLIRAKVEKSRNLYVQASNTSGDAYDATMTDDMFGPGDGDYSLRWFKGKQDITSLVRGSGYDFSVANGDQQRFRVRVKVLANNPKRLCFIPLMQGDAFGGNDTRFALNGRTACEPN